MRAFLLALLALVPLAARATGDAHDGVALAGFATMVDGSRAKYAAFAGAGGLGYAQSFGEAFGFATYAWRSSAVEVGATTRLGLSRRVDVWGSVSLAVAPVGGLTVGPRGLLFVGGRFGDTLVFRPGISASLARIGGPDVAPTTLVPLEASLEIGLRAARVRPFLRFAAGAELLASRHFTGRGEIALGIAIPESP